MTELESMELQASELRLRILQTALKAKKGHVPPAFSCLDILVALYYGGHLRIDPNWPKKADRDRLILSKGHGCLALYSILENLGFFSADLLENFVTDGHMLAGHPDPEIPGVEVVSGSLGHGLGVGCGLALGAKMSGETWRVFTILGDGECDEGSIWEAAMFAPQHKLSQLTAIIDRNKLSATDFTENVISLEPLSERFESFGWKVISINGHSFSEINQALSSRDSDGRPILIIANTVKGKGVTLMENSPFWHHSLPKGAEIEIALGQLEKTRDELKRKKTSS